MKERNAYNALLGELCVGLGWCGTIKHEKPLHVDDFVPPSGPVTADQFAEWVILADNLNPNLEIQQRAKIRAAFVRHMGADVVDAAKLR